MKILFSVFLVLFLFACTTNLNAQNMTIILLRHAEKDLSPTANKDDPDLTVAGQQRAERLFEVIKKYKPEQFFSTAYKRTRATVAPLAEQIEPGFRIQMQYYDYNYLDDFAARLLKLNAKCVVVVGHNTTTPMLANALIKQDKYQFLEDSDYGKIWIIKIRGKKIIDKVIEY